MRTVYQGGQQDEAWRALRLGCATASNFGAVMAKGVGGGEAATRRDYRIKLALELFTGQPSEPMPPSFDMRIGIEREPEARHEFELETGLLLQQVSFVKLDGQLVGCSPDALIGLDSGLEAKCPKEATHLEYLSLTTKPPAVYVPQVQGCMHVTGRSSWHFCSYNPRFPPELRLHWIKVERDEAYITRLEEELFKFNFEVRKTVDEMHRMIEKRKVARAAANFAGDALTLNSKPHQHLNSGTGPTRQRVPVKYQTISGLMIERDRLKARNAELLAALRLAKC